MSEISENLFLNPFRFTHRPETRENRFNICDPCAYCCSLERQSKTMRETARFLMFALILSCLHLGGLQEVTTPFPGVRINFL